METNSIEQRMLTKVPGILHANEIAPNPEVVRAIADEAGAWQKEMVANINALIKEWESRMGEDDTTLYSLGIRQVRDLVRGESFDFDRLPPL